jgi:tRNA A-37 threonylcarbamoyl transferase component Bud32
VPDRGSSTAAYVPPAELLDATRPAPPGQAPPGPPSRGGVSLVTDTRDPDADLTALVRRRLRQLVIVFLAAYAAFLLRDVLTPQRIGLHFQKVAFLVVVPVQLALAALTWSAWASSARRLRALELIVLGVCWTALSSIHFDWLCNWDDLNYYLNGDRAADGQILVANTWVLPWFALIACYPVVVPNTVRRTIGLACLMAVLPFAVTAAAVFVSDRLSWANSVLMFVQFAIWCPLAVALAVYGAHQAGLLRAQAFAAKRFGQYRLTHQLGGGGMGEVYLAEHTLLRRPSVVKVIRPDRDRDPALLERFAREVQTLATLTHWNTVEVFDYGHTADGTFYYVMEFLPGYDLDKLVIAHGPLPPARAVHLLRQVCAALREAHAAGLIHRDIKPSNVMACVRGGVPDVAKLLDFGLVQTAVSGEADAKLTRQNAVLGSPAFMAAEQAAGRSCDARSDVYSLGATAFFLLVGRAPFAGTATEVLAAHINLAPPCPRAANPDVPADLAALVTRCMAKNPADRFARVEDLEAALAACACTAEWDVARAETWWAANPVKSPNPVAV